MEHHISGIEPIDRDNDYFDEYDDKNSTYEEFKEIVNNIGGNDFQAAYEANRDDFSQLEDPYKIIICRAMYNKVVEDLGIMFAPEPNFLDCDHRKYFLEFIEFFHFDYIDFFVNLFIELDVPLGEIVKPKFSQDFILNNLNIILKTIDEKILRIFSHNWILSQFLGTYNKDKLKMWLIKNLKKDKSLIVIELSNVIGVDDG